MLEKSWLAASLGGAMKSGVMAQFQPPCKQQHCGQLWARPSSTLRWIQILLMIVVDSHDVNCLMVHRFGTKQYKPNSFTIPRYNNSILVGTLLHLLNNNSMKTCLHVNPRSTAWQCIPWWFQLAALGGLQLWFVLMLIVFPSWLVGYSWID